MIEQQKEKFKYVEDDSDNAEKDYLIEEYEQKELDKLKEDESQKDVIDYKNLKFCIIYPFYRYKIYWDAFVIIILISSIILTPIDLGFPDIRDGSDEFNWIMYSIDLLFLSDLIFNFFSAYEDD